MSSEIGGSQIGKLPKRALPWPKSHFFSGLRLRSPDRILSLMRLSIRRKGLIFVGLSIVFQIAFVAVVAWHLRRAAADDRWEDHSRAVIANADRVVSLLVEIESGVRGYIITNDRCFLRPSQAAL